MKASHYQLFSRWRGGHNIYHVGSLLSVWEGGDTWQWWPCWFSLLNMYHHVGAEGTCWTTPSLSDSGWHNIYWDGGEGKGSGGGYLVKCCVYISSCTNWSEGILSGDWERLEASNISPQLSLHNWKVCINNYVSALRCNSKRLQTSPPSLCSPWHFGQLMALPGRSAVVVMVVVSSNLYSGGCSLPACTGRQMMKSWARWGVRRHARPHSNATSSLAGLWALKYGDISVRRNCLWWSRSGSRHKQR